MNINTLNLTRWLHLPGAFSYLVEIPIFVCMVDYLGYDSSYKIARDHPQSGRLV